MRTLVFVQTGSVSGQQRLVRSAQIQGAVLLSPGMIGMTSAQLRQAGGTPSIWCYTFVSLVGFIMRFFKPHFCTGNERFLKKIFYGKKPSDLKIYMYANCDLPYRRRHQIYFYRFSLPPPVVSHGYGFSFPTVLKCLDVNRSSDFHNFPAPT